MTSPRQPWEEAIDSFREQHLTEIQQHVWPRARDGKAVCVACGLVITEDNMLDVRTPCLVIP